MLLRVYIFINFTLIRAHHLITSAHVDMAEGQLEEEFVLTDAKKMNSGGENVSSEDSNVESESSEEDWEFEYEDWQGEKKDFTKKLNAARCGVVGTNSQLNGAKNHVSQGKSIQVNINVHTVEICKVVMCAYYPNSVLKTK